MHTKYTKYASGTDLLNMTFCQTETDVTYIPNIQSMLQGLICSIWHSVRLRQTLHTYQIYKVCFRDWSAQYDILSDWDRRYIHTKYTKYASGTDLLNMTFCQTETDVTYIPNIQSMLQGLICSIWHSVRLRQTLHTYQMYKVCFRDWSAQYDILSDWDRRYIHTKYTKYASGTDLLNMTFCQTETDVTYIPNIQSMLQGLICSIWHSVRLRQTLHTYQIYKVCFRDWSAQYDILTDWDRRYIHTKYTKYASGTDLLNMTFCQTETDVTYIPNIQSMLQGLICSIWQLSDWDRRYIHTKYTKYASGTDLLNMTFCQTETDVTYIPNIRSMLQGLICSIWHSVRLRQTLHNYQVYKVSLGDWFAQYDIPPHSNRRYISSIQRKSRGLICSIWHSATLK